jgi:hypothetical protein
MKEKNNRYVIRGSEWVKKTVPSTKQIEEKPTNKEIECEICSRMTDKSVRIVRISGSSAYLNGMCCDRCIFTHRFNKDIVLIDGDNNTLTPETITIGQIVPTNDKGWLDDSTKETYYERLDKYRRGVANMRKINKAFGTLMPTYKQELEHKLRTMDYLPIEVRREIYNRIKKGEIKID